MRPCFHLAVLFGCISTRAVSGIEHGNGGGVIVCPGTEKYQLLDFFEQEQIFKLDLDTGPTGEGDYKKIAKYWLEKYNKTAAFRQAMWGSYVEGFESEAEWLTGMSLGETNDIGGAIIPSNCKFELVVIQESPSEIRPKRFYVNRDIWDKLAPLQKAGLVLHEAIYREALIYGHDNSKVARYLVALWTSRGMHPELKTKDSVNALLQRNRFLAGDVDGCSPALYQFSRLASGALTIDWNFPNPTFSIARIWSGDKNVFSDSFPIMIHSTTGTMGAHCIGSSYYFGQMISNSIQPISGQMGNADYNVTVSPDYNIKSSRFYWQHNYEIMNESATGIRVEWPSILTLKIQDQMVQATTAYFSNKNNRLLQVNGAINFRKLKGRFNKLFSSKPGFSYDLAWDENGELLSCRFNCLEEWVVR